MARRSAWDQHPGGSVVALLLLLLLVLVRVVGRVAFGVVLEMPGSTAQLSAEDLVHHLCALGEGRPDLMAVDQLRGGSPVVPGQQRDALYRNMAVLEQRGHLSEGRWWLSEGLERPAVVAPSVRVNGLVGAARLAMDQAVFDEAAEHCAQAVALARQLGEPHMLATALNTQGLLARGQDRYADSVRDHQAALEQARAATDRAGEAVALLGLAYGAMFAGDGPG